MNTIINELQETTYDNNDMKLESHEFALFLEKINELGISLEKLWRRSNYNENSFLDIAVETIRAINSLPHIDPKKLVAGFCETLEGLKKSSFNFSDITFKLYEGMKFSIDFLLWMEGTTTIHQHSFTGAFTVYHGQSLHCIYDFKDRIKINSRFHEGTLKLEKSEILSPGDIREIPNSTCLIHSLFHLWSPSATIVIRTKKDIDAGPQFNYMKPYFAIAPELMDSITYNLSRTLLKFIELDRGLALKALRSACTRLSLDGIYAICSFLIRKGVPGDDIINVIKSFDCTFSMKLEAVLIEEQKNRQLINLRRTILNPEQRNILACLLNLPDYKSIHEAIKTLNDSNDVNTIICNFVEEIGKINSLFRVENLERFRISLDNSTSICNNSNDSFLHNHIYRPLFK